MWPHQFISMVLRHQFVQNLISLSFSFDNWGQFSILLFNLKKKIDVGDSIKNWEWGSIEIGFREERIIERLTEAKVSNHPRRFSPSLNRSNPSFDSSFSSALRISFCFLEILLSLLLSHWSRRRLSPPFIVTDLWRRISYCFEIVREIFFVLRVESNEDGDTRKETQDLRLKNIFPRFLQLVTLQWQKCPCCFYYFIFYLYFLNDKKATRIHLYKRILHHYWGWETETQEPLHSKNKIIYNTKNYRYIYYLTHYYF